MTQRWPRLAVTSAARRTTRDVGALGVSVGFYLIVSSVLAGLWRAAAGAHGGAVVGYSARQLTWYIAWSEAATVALPARLIEYIGDDIASGAISVELLRPVPVLEMRLATELGRCLPRLAACLLAGSGMAMLTVGAPPSTAGLLLSLPAMVLAASCNLAAQHAFAGASFWVRDARSAWFLYHKFVFVLGGMLLPLQVLPHSLRVVAEGLPFMAMAYVPARLASGHVEPALLAVQAGWLVVLLVLARAVFGAGERRLQVVGG